MEPGQSASVLYITYDGLLEPLGYSQVFQYLRRLSRKHRIVVVSYEKAEDWNDVRRRMTLAEEAEAAGVRWTALRYHKRPTAIATSWDLTVGFAVCVYLVLRWRIQMVHARSYVPAVLGLGLKRLLGTRFIFDMRGFWADERVEGGLWSRDSVLFRVAKVLEREFLMHADVVVSLTHAGVAALHQLPYLRGRTPRFEVIPTCTDLELFRTPSSTERAGGSASRPFTLGYVGSVGLWYTFDPVLECFKILRAMRPNARLVVLNREQHAYIWDRVRAHGLSDDSVELKAVEYTSVPEEMARMDAGIFFSRPTFSNQARAPTKLGEFLGCGVPCLTNRGTGDVERVLEGEGVGVVLPTLEGEAMRLGVQRLLALVDRPDTPARCRSVAEKYFDLRAGVAAYDDIYSSLAARATTGPADGSLPR